LFEKARVFSEILKKIYSASIMQERIWRKVVGLGLICVKKRCIFCNFLVKIYKKGAFFVIFRAIFVFLAIFFTILGSFGVVVT
jgi:hypothetical protein